VDARNEVKKSIVKVAAEAAGADTGTPGSSKTKYIIGGLAAAVVAIGGYLLWRHYHKGETPK